jgi:hypothetical protein
MQPRVVENRGAVFLQTIGRLRPGVTLSQAEAELNTIIGRLAEEHPETESSGHRVVITPLTEYVFGNARPALWVLLAATGVLLLMACPVVGSLSDQEGWVQVFGCTPAAVAGSEVSDTAPSASGSVAALTKSRRIDRRMAILSS